MMKIFHKNKSQKSNIKGFLSKLSQAFMLPISILPFAGLLLGIGGAISANVEGQPALDFANFLKGMSEVVFGNLPVLFAATIAMAFTKHNSLSAVFMVIIAYLVFNGVQRAFIHYDEAGNFKDVFFFHTNTSTQYMIGSNLGIKSLQTSIFGGILIGALVSYVMNRFSNIQLPAALNFFSGIRLVPMILIPISALMAFAFLLLWPFVGLAISEFGNISNKAPGGIDGLIYGMIGRSLMPFGLHHIIIGMAFQSSMGGELNLQDVQATGQTLGITTHGDFQTLVAELQNKNSSIVGDQNIWNFINSLPFNRMAVNNLGETQPIFQWFSDHVGIYAGRFTQDYPIYIGACMGIGVAMILAAERKNRKKTTAIVGSSMAVAFLTGITEPLEFSFLFVAPLFYYIIYVPLSGMAYMFMKIFGAHVGVGFARGFLDLMIYGAIPVAKGTRFYLAFPIALVFGLITFVTLFFGIKKFNWETPGRGENLVLINKKTYNKIKNNKEQDPEIIAYVQAYGGITNIVNILACATRLRITVKNKAKIKKTQLKKLGSQGFIEQGTFSQNILGGKAAIIADKIKTQYNLK